MWDAFFYFDGCGTESRAEPLNIAPCQRMGYASDCGLHKFIHDKTLEIIGKRETTEQERCSQASWVSDVENRPLSAAALSLSCPAFKSHIQLFSGQVDIYQLGLDHFGIEFLDRPLSKGLVGQPLIYAFADAIASYMSRGKTLTKKTVWSFTDAMEDALHYFNGILLVANHAGNSRVWDQAACVAEPSDNPKKTEYVFMPWFQFGVQSVDTARVDDKQVVVVTLRARFGKKQGITKLDLTGKQNRRFRTGGLHRGGYSCSGTPIQSVNAISLERAIVPKAMELPCVSPV